MNIQLILSQSSKIIFANEGSYGSVNKDDNGAVSIGKIQWHGNRALSLLKKILKDFPAGSKEILGRKLYSEVVKLTTNWSKRILTTEEAAKVSVLLMTPYGKSAQDTQAEADVWTYIKNGMKLGITDYKTLIYYADVENQGGAGASKRIGKAAIKKAKSAILVNLDIYHACALEDKVMKKYAKRRNIVYDKCKNVVL